MKKKLKWVAIAIVAIFAFFVVIGLLSGEGKKSLEQGKQDAKELVESQKQGQNQTTYTIAPKAEVGSSEKIKVSGTSNLPNGSLLDVTAQRQVVLKGETEAGATLQGMGIAKASVWDGNFTTTTEPLDDRFSSWLEAVGDEVTSVGPNVLITVSFNPKREEPAQKDEVLAVVGTNG